MSRQSLDNPQIVVDALQALLQQGGVKHVWVDYDNTIDRKLIGESWTASAATTQVVERDVICKRELDSGAGRHIRSGKERGAVVAALANAEDAARCYAIVCDTERRRGNRPRYPESLYRKLAELSMKDSRVIWLLCRVDYDIIGFHICLQIGDELLSWQPYIDYSRRECKPAYLLMDEVFTIARSRNSLRINLGGSPASATGLKEFKRRFGAVEREYNIYTHLSLMGKAFSWALR